ncbi:MAG: sulfite exporter TauE/SafE family protein [Pseudomonadota bacterium]
MGIIDILVLVGIGFLGGVWNAVAGGATLFTFPGLMWAGLPPVVANATNFLALLPSNAAALPAYLKELCQVGRDLVPLTFVSGLGATLGSVMLIYSDPGVFERLIPALILTATLLFAFGDAVRAKLLALAGGTRTGMVVYAGLFVASIYGGYFGAGLGIILLAVAQIMGHSDFHVANAIKNFLATSFSILSIVVFGLGGLIAWPQAFAMMAGSTVGGYLGGRLAKHIRPQLLRGAVILFGLVLSAVYAWRVYA